jgi:hypothetical protein
MVKGGVVKDSIFASQVSPKFLAGQCAFLYCSSGNEALVSKPRPIDSVPREASNNIVFPKKRDC